MRWNAGFSVSDEYDYFHLGVNGRFERDFNQRNTTVFVGAAYAQDDINPVGGAPIGFAPMLEVDNDDSNLAARRHRRTSSTLLVGVTQMLEPALAAGSSATPTARATAT